jgi:acyl-CoA thioesterase-1
MPACAIHFTSIRVGDSLSAGIGGNLDTWPKLFARRYHVDLHDLSRSSADAATAMQQAAQMSGPNSVVLVEIGGNDVLRGYPPEVHERSLDALLARLRDGGRRTVIMLELPLPPFSNRYAAAQRRQARTHGVLLVPKRVLMGVLTAEDAALDTIHLSARGRRLMADAVWNAISAAFGQTISSGGTPTSR